VVGAVVDHQHVTDAGELGQEGGHLQGELALVDECLQVGVGEQVAQLVFDVAVVDVDPDRSELEDRPCGLDPLDPVVRVDADMVTLSDAVRCEVVASWLARASISA